MKLITIFLSFTLKFFHILFTIIAFIGPLVTNDILVLAFLFVVNALVIFCWVLNGGVCFLSPLEQKLDGVAYKYSKGITKNFMAVCLDKIIKNEMFTFILITMIPVLNILIISYKIYKITTYTDKCDLCMSSDNINIDVVKMYSTFNT